MKGILLDENGDIMVRSGSMVIGNVDAQIAEHVVVAFTGEYKEAPLLGGNAKTMIAGNPDPFWTGNVKAQLRGEGVAVKKLNVNENGIELVIEQ